ncbi:hypothetical protein GGTG_11128 [Gaeumannomyces tritici R3-111a-1]|uniref:Uncharacterized protein n=1 Tax=Gaeumannomyces tritici (strain R3-111a-1) TaxID=644352 RepID=J3PCA5_GAET3|nr:hypothetical protein GGTG_11128 [Gaeumannomyces tritici R3-111a-1]EJT71875.1 hypothetical protein GGTG_11128 [Gaeumannomyces tritici R3-111a-1]
METGGSLRLGLAPNTPAPGRPQAASSSNHAPNPSLTKQQNRLTAYGACPDMARCALAMFGRPAFVVAPSARDQHIISNADATNRITSLCSPVLAKNVPNGLAGMGRARGLQPPGPPPRQFGTSTAVEPVRANSADSNKGKADLSDARLRPSTINHGDAAVFSEPPA